MKLTLILEVCDELEGCCSDGAPRKNGEAVMWKAHTLLPVRDRDARFEPTIVMRRAEEVLQRRGAGKGRGGQYVEGEYAVS